MLRARTRARVRFGLSLIGVGLFLAVGSIAAKTTGETAFAPERAFLLENQTAADKMMRGMDAQPTGDVDSDFAAAMIPHHQGAIEMAQAELRFGRNERLRRIAQEIVVDQQQEIVAIGLALNQSFPRPSPAGDPPISTGRASFLTALALKLCTGRPR